MDVVPSYENEILRVELEGNTIKKIKEVNLLNGDVKTALDKFTLYPARQYVVPEEKHALALELIKTGIGSTVAQSCLRLKPTD